jgi:aspartate racemase
LNDTARVDEVVGVLGGMGPVASAEFVLTIYGYCSGQEQAYPVVVLHSDPGVAVRSMLRDGPIPQVSEPVQRGLQKLYEHGCTSVVVCCMTLHHLFAELPWSLRAGIASALDVLFEGVAAAAPRRQLMLCSAAAVDLGLFTDDPRWPSVSSFVVWPDEEDLATLQKAIWDIKENRGVGSAARWLDSCLPKYGASTFVVGCSEVHVLAKKVTVPGMTAVDPFDILARAVATRTIHALRTKSANKSKRY